MNVHQLSEQPSQTAPEFDSHLTLSRIRAKRMQAGPALPGGRERPAPSRRLIGDRS